MLSWKRRSVRVPIAIVAAAVAVTAGAADAHAARSTPSTGTVVLTGDVLPGLSSLPSAPVGPDQSVQVGVTLANPQAAAQQAAYDAIYDPASPSYHHYLSAVDVAQRFGVDGASFAAVRDWATRDGLNLVSTTGTHEYLLLEGTAAQVQNTFSVTLRQYTQTGNTFYANTAGPTVPAGLGIAGVLGLNSRNRAQTFHTKPPASAPHGPTPGQSMCTGPTCIGLTTPQDLWSIYDQPGNNFGEGQQMAVFGEGQVQPVLENLRAFESANKLPKVPITVSSVGDDFKDNAGEVEWDLDTQSSTGMSPNAYGETLYFGKDLTDAAILGTFDAWSGDQNGPLQANASFGECEEDPTSSSPTNGAQTPVGGLAGSSSKMFTDGSNNALMQATLQGKTLFSSTGDTGSSCPVIAAAGIGAGNGVLDQGYPETNYPASSPYVVAVGGTVLYGTPNTATPTATTQPSNSKRAVEYAWTFTGGGNTLYIQRPAYQDNISTLATPCLTQPDGTPYSDPTVPCRGIPDVAAQSGDVASNGYGITAMGQNNYPGGGTSLASPLWMGMWTRMQAAATTKNSAGAYTNGFANPALYKIGSDPTKAGAFFDIGGGGTTAPVTNNGYYASTPGWDYVSGLGTPDVTKLATDLTGKTTPTNPLKAPAPTDCSQPGITCGPGSTLGSAGATINPCTPLFTDPKGDDAFIGDPAGMGGNPQLDIVQGDMHTVTKGGVSELETVLTIADLSKNAASAGGAANEYYFLWTYTPLGKTATTYFTNAEVDSATGAVAYHDGTVSGTTYTTANTDTGSVNAGKNGTVVVDVPLKNIGSLTSGDQLTATSAQTKVLVGTTATGGLIEAADSAGPGQSYVLGEVCAATGQPGSSGGGSTSQADYLPQTPSRILSVQSISPNGTYAFALPSSVPAGTGAVAFNVTAVRPNTVGNLRVFADCGGGVTRTSLVNYQPGKVTANFVVVPLQCSTGSAPVRTIDFYSDNSSVSVDVDLAGTYPTTTSGTGSSTIYTTPGFTAVGPNREASVTSIPAGTSHKFTLTGLPAGAKAVALNVTSVDASGYGNLRVYPGDQTTAPNTSNINFIPGVSKAGFVIVNLPADGSNTINIYSDGVTSNVDVDVFGVFPARSSTTGLAQPVRVLDTRTGSRTTQSLPDPLQTGTPYNVTVTGGITGVPANASAVVVSLTAIPAKGGTGVGNLRAYPAGGTTPDVSNINYIGPKPAVANLAIVKIGANGQITLVTKGSVINAAVDILGYVPAVSAAP